MPHVRDVHPVHSYLAGDDAARADDFTAAWAAPDVRAIVCVRGGYGAQRMIDLVDWAALRAAEPKVLVGYSDVTALHQAVAARLGLVTLHGPMSGTGSFVSSLARAGAPAADAVRAGVGAGAVVPVGAARWSAAPRRA